MPSSSFDPSDHGLTLTLLFSIFRYMQNSSSTLDVWRLGAVLGSGRHGMVLRASHRDDENEVVAIKIPTHGQSLFAEAHALEQVGAHPHIVELLDGPMANGELVLAFCERGSLAERGDGEWLNADEAAAILSQIASALGAIHAAGWIHGDIAPANIGLRADGTVALLDFATARAADGSPLDEGTAEFAGTCRRADQRVDIRCLAASVMTVLPDPTADPSVTLDARQLRAHLEEIIERCDRGETPTIDDLTRLPEHITPTQISAAKASSRRWTSGPRTPRTAEFGPRPGGQPEADDETSRPLPLRYLIGLVAVIVVLSGVLFEPARTAASAPKAAELIDVTASADSLRDGGVEWVDGLAIVTSDDESTTTFAVGESGDLATLGDWSCDGLATIGVYRPSTGSWFTFDAWDAGALSSVEQLEVNASVLSVEHHSDGCDRPRIR